MPSQAGAAYGFYQAFARYGECLCAEPFHPRQLLDAIASAS